MLHFALLNYVVHFNSPIKPYNQAMFPLIYWKYANHPLPSDFQLKSNKSNKM